MVDWPGENLCIKIIETLGAGVGKLGAPWQIIREGRARAQARREELLLLAQTEQDIDAVRAGKKSFVGGQLLEIAPVAPELLCLPGAAASAVPGQGAETLAFPSVTEPVHFLEGLNEELVLREAIRRLNLRRIGIYAQEEAERIGDEPVSEQPVDPDWFTRWRELSQDVTSEDLQRVWARVLAGEVKAPGSYSLRLLDFMKNLSRDEAGAIEKVGSYVVSDFIFMDDDFFNGVGINFSDWLYLEELGVVDHVNQISGLMKLVSLEPGGVTGYLCHKKVIIIKNEGASKVEHKVSVINVTRLGRKLFSLGSFAARDDYLCLMAKSILKSGLSVYIADVRAASEGGLVNYYNEVKVEP